MEGQMIGQNEISNRLESQPPLTLIPRNPEGSSRTHSSWIVRFKWAMYLVWTLVVTVQLAYLIYHDFKDVRSIALMEARVHFNKDEAVRRWVARHGGAYVPIDEHTPPNPYLNHITERDIETPSGKRLTLMNPAYVMRQMKQEYSDLYGIAGHLTSLNLLRPQNAPDDWEREALLAFAQGAKELTEFTEINGQPYLRLMRPLYADAGCLKCHSGQVSKAGDLRGGISISLPMSPLLKNMWDGIYSTLLSLGLLWALGIGGISLSARSLIKRSRERDLAIEELQKHHDHLEELVQERTSEISRANEQLHREISDRVRTERALREQKDLLENTIEALNHPFFVIDARDYSVVLANSAARIYRNAQVGSKCYMFTHKRNEPCNTKEYKCPLAEVIRTKMPVQSEHIHYDANGDPFYIEIHAFPIIDEGGEVCQMIEYGIDITERKRAEVALRESEANLKAAQRIARLGRWELDLVNNRLQWSESIFEIFGIDPVIFGASYEAFLEAIHPDDREIVNRAYIESVKNKTPYEITHRLLMKDGQIKWVNESCQTEYDQQGQAIRSIGIVQDITERKLIENAQSFLLQLGLSASGEDFFEALARYLAETMNMDYVCINRLSGDCLSAQTVAIYCDGRIEDNVSYTLKDTPCDEVAGKTICCYPKDVRHLFPKDAALQELGAESYVGTTLWSCEGKPIGLIAVIGRQPFANPKPAESMLKSIAVYAASELERREAEAEIRHLSSFPELNPNPVVEFDREGEILYINKSAKSILARWNLTDPRAFFPSDIKEILTAFAEGSATQFQREIRINGLTFSGIFHFTPEFNSVRLYAHDITERKKAEEEVGILSRAVEQSPAALVITDIKGNIEYANPKFFRLTGYDPREIIGQNPRLLKSGVHSREFYEELWSTILSGNDWRGEICNKKKNGELYWVDASISPFRNSLGEITHFLSVKEEITERKEMEAFLKQAKEKAEEATRAKSDFLANMSHEIRTPMNGIIGMTELLLETPLNEAQKEYASKILASMESLMTIINDILDFSKIEAGKLSLESTPFDLEKVVEEVINLFRLPAIQKNVELIVHYGAQAPNIFIGDPGRIRQILVNLTGNAVKFTRQGSVLLDVRSQELLPEKERLHFSIQDTGIGIPSDKLNVVFDKFSQADSSTTRMFGGTGLGLSICKHLVEIMGGSIEVFSELGKGTTFAFSLELPVIKENLETFAEKSGVICDSVLIVDDNEINRRIYSKYLSQWNIRHRAAATGEEALEILRGAREKHESFELAIIDRQMPGMDGEALGRAIQADEALRGLRMIMFSSTGDKKDEQRMKQLGFESYWNKPVTRSVFFNAIQTAGGVRKKPESVESQERFAPGEKIRNLRILLVEDNKFNQQVALGFLERFGYQADVAEDGREALEKWEKNSYNLVFMDVHMPVMDGYSTTREIRLREKGNRSTVIVAMTANAMKGDREKCLAAGMDDYIAKPMRMREMRSVIEKYYYPSASVERQALRDGLAADESATVRENIKESESAVFVLSEALKCVSGNFSRLRKMIEIALKDIPIQIQFLTEALEQGEREAAERRAHTIKGEAANIGAQQLRWKAQEIEQFAAAGDMISAAKELTALRDEFRQAREAIEKTDWEHHENQ
ncbi:MAG: response regulator [Candidatus Omnitrophota bacterium]